MITSALQIDQDGKKAVVGSIITQQPITGSRVNECGIVEISLDKDSNEKDFMSWLLAQKFWIDGSPRYQQVWDVKDISQRGGLAVLTKVILKPDGMCIACAGRGTLQGTRHKATAKCPSCKGKGFVTGLWPEEQKIDGNEERGDAGAVVAESRDAGAAPEGPPGGDQAGDRREEGSGGGAQG